MNLLEWRQNPERRSLALDLLNQQTMQEMLSVMELEHPAKQQHSAHDGFGATKILGRIEGFQQALDMIRNFAEPLPLPPASVPVTWGANTEEEIKPR